MATSYAAWGSTIKAKAKLIFPLRAIRGEITFNLGPEINGNFHVCK